MRCYPLGCFYYVNGELHCEQVPVAAIADETGTPVYVYSRATLAARFQAVRAAFASVETTICFSVKSCSTRAVLAAMREFGSGFDVVSGGEIRRVLAAGGDASRIVYAGVGKTDAEIRLALEQGIMMFNVESAEELANIDRIAGELGLRAPVALRLNPDVDAHTHAKTTTGKKENKFGIPPEAAADILRHARRYEHVDFLGVDAHIGSPVNSVTPYAQAVGKLADFVLAHRTQRTPLPFINTGGGFGLLYHDEQVPTFADYAAAILPHVQRAGCKLILEPGRSIAGNSAVLLGRVQYRKQSGAKTFVIIDAGMHTLLRPAMYDSYHHIWPARGETPAPQPACSPSGGDVPSGLVPTDLVGPICESSDVFCRDRPLPPLRRGDLVAIFSAGAYGFSMSSQYNSHPRAAEVMVAGNEWRVIRERETYEDLVRGESA